MQNKFTVMSRFLWKKNFNLKFLDKLNPRIIPGVDSADWAPAAGEIPSFPSGFRGFTAAVPAGICAE